jgi:hypothetical protein
VANETGLSAIPLFAIRHSLFAFFAIRILPYSLFAIRYSRLY